MTPQAERWFMGMDDKSAQRIAAAFDAVVQGGPAVRRPAVGLIEGSRYNNMKEFRSFGGHLRALFVFEDRRALVLLGGDKTHDWKGWYRTNVPRADRMLAEHRRTSGKEATWRTGTRAGVKFGVRER